MLSSSLRNRKVWKRAAVVGGTAAASALAFPYVEDAYWVRKDPTRVQFSKEDSPGSDDNKTKKKKLVILGTGWASVSVLKHVDRDLYDIKVVSPRNFFTYTPLLPVSDAKPTVSKRHNHNRFPHILLYHVFCL